MLNSFCSYNCCVPSAARYQLHCGHCQLHRVQPGRLCHPQLLSHWQRILQVIIIVDKAQHFVHNDYAKHLHKYMRAHTRTHHFCVDQSLSVEKVVLCRYVGTAGVVNKQCCEVAVQNLGQPHSSCLCPSVVGIPWRIPPVNKAVRFSTCIDAEVVWFCFQVILLPILQRRWVQERLGSGGGLWETQQRNCPR